MAPPALAFLLVNEPRLPNAADVVALADQIGVVLEVIPPTEANPATERILQFKGEGDITYLAALMEVPHPDAPHMPYGPLAADREAAIAAPAHFILTGLGIDGDHDARALFMAGFTAAMIRSTAAVGAMLGEGAILYKAQVFAELAAVGVEQGELPIELAVDVRVAPEPDERVGFLTHGLAARGSEELFVTAPQQGKGALGFVYDIARWFLNDPAMRIPTGDTIGRQENEKLIVARVASPTGQGEVVRIDLP